MKFEFKDVLGPPPVIQERKKYATFTVREIGGPLELAKWKKEQAEKWAAYQANREVFKEKQKQFIAGPEAPEGNGITWAGKAEVVGYRGGMSWQERLELVLNERKRLANPDSDFITPPKLEVPYQELKPTHFQRFKTWVSNVWKSANFS